MKNVFIATSRPIGELCEKWARSHTPEGFRMVDNISDADIILSVMYEKIIPPVYTRTKKCFNFHPGVLPEYKGSGAFSWVLINQESKAGITLHLIDEGVDTGDVIEIREFLIDKKDTAVTLFQRGEETIYKMFKGLYSDLLQGHYTAIPQKKGQGTFYYRKDLQRAKNLTRFIRAFHFPGKEAAYYFNNRSQKIYINYDSIEGK